MDPQPIDPARKASSVPYLIALVVMTLIGVVAVLVIVIALPDRDNTQLVATVIGFLATMAGVIMTFIKGQETHVMVNSGFAAWKLDNAAKNYAEGMGDGVKKEQERVAAMSAVQAGQKTQAALATIATAATAAQTTNAAPAATGDRRGQMTVGTVNGRQENPNIDITAERLNVIVADPAAPGVPHV